MVEIKNIKEVEEVNKGGDNQEEEILIIRLDDRETDVKEEIIADHIKKEDQETDFKSLFN